MQFNSYTLVICLIVYIGLVSLFAFTITIITKQTLKLTRLGAEDEKIKTEYLKNKDKKQSVTTGIINLVIPIVACIVMLALFIGSIVVGALSNNVVGDIPVLKVVSSASMASKYERNEYLFDNELDDQLQVYDLIFAHKLPDEKDLKKYDIVVYEVEPGILLIHRIVNIEEPNERHPNERYFLLQGDSVPTPDKFPVRYSQMKGIYRGVRIPFVGSIVVFMQSTAGVLCMMLIVFAAFIMPFLEKKFENEKRLRLIAMGLIAEDGTEINNGQAVTTPVPSPETESVANTPPPLPEPEPISAEETPPVVTQTETVSVVDDTAPTTLESEEETVSTIVEPIVQTEIATTIDDIEDFTEDDDDLPEDDLVDEKWYHSLTGRKGLTFKQKLDGATDEVLNRYAQIITHLYKVDGVRVLESKTAETYKKGNKPITKISFRGKTLCVYLPLNPSEYLDTKYIYSETTAKAYKNYPMRIKVTSDRQAKWVNELISEVATNYGVNMLEVSKLISLDGSVKIFEQEPIETPETPAEKWYHSLTGRKGLTFKQKLDGATDEVLNRYAQIIAHLYKVDGVRVLESKTAETYKKGNKPIAKISFRGKTLCVNLSLNPSEYLDTKYIYSETTAKAYKNYPMRIKVTSDRQAKWVNELISEVATKYGVNMLEVSKLIRLDGSVKIFEQEPIETPETPAEKWYHSLTGRKGLTFKQKLDGATDETLKRYYQILTHLYKVKGLKVWESRAFETYKRGSTPIAKISFRGKTLCVNLALPPSEYLDTKYIYSETTAKAYKNYPMRIKVTSDRQAKWVNELISEIAKKNEIYMYAISKLVKIQGNDKTFEQRLKESSENTKNWFKEINDYLLGLDGIRTISAKKQITYKIKSKNLAKVRILGKTLNVYLALAPKKFKDTKYKFIDASGKKAYEKYPMRIKITSARQAKWAIELIQKI